MNPKVSVCIVTYNQENYIGACLDSVLSQKTDFDFEIIVGDDASTDKTKDIIIEFAKKHPEYIKPILHEKNIGPTANILSTYRLAQAPYIAHLDGDDLMLENKLQTQLNILESNKDCIACTHDVHLINPEGKVIQNHWKIHPNGKKDIYYLLENLPYFAHSSKFFRKNSFLPVDIEGELIDCNIHYLQAKNGAFYHIEIPLGEYRLLAGVTHQKKALNKTITNRVCTIYDTALNELPQTERVKKAYAKSLMEFAYQSAALGNSQDFCYFIAKSIETAEISKLQKVMALMAKAPYLACLLAKTRSCLRPGGMFRR
jgi:glycosyltransferase involved in cell wall biosynthesis